MARRNASTSADQSISQPERARLAPWSVGILLATLVWLTAFASILLMRDAGGLAVIWPANAIALAATLRMPPRAGPMLLGCAWVGNTLANIAAGDPAVLALALASCNTIEIAVASLLLRRFGNLAIAEPVTAPGGSVLNGPRNLLVFAIGCAGVAPAVSAALAGGILHLLGGSSFTSTWATWFLADALGILAITPVVMSLGGPDARGFAPRERIAELLLLLGVSAGVSLATFSQVHLPLLFLLFPLVILPAFRLSFAGTALNCCLVSALAIAATLLGHGPLMLVSDFDERQRILLLQLFLVVLNLTALPVAAALTAQRLTQATLQGVSNLQRAILDGADYSIIATDIDGTITHFNSGAARMLGYRPDEVIGKATPSLFHLQGEVEARAEALSAELKQPVESGYPALVARSHLGPDEHDWTYVRKDGTRFPARISITALRGADGSISGYLGIGKDITEQRRYEENLAQSRRDLQRIIDNIPAMIAYWDKDLHNRFCNRAYVEWFGKSPDQIMTGMHIREVIGEKLFALNRRYMEGALRGELQSFEREIPIPSGERRHTQAHYIPDFQRGKVEGFYVLVFDISALKQTEIALKQAKDAAESATRAKSAFLSRMSHELRTPMNSIIGFTELLQTRHPGPLNERQVEYLGLVHFSAEHLLHLIDDILELSRIEAGRLKIAEQRVTVAPLVKSVLFSLQPLAEKRGIAIRDRIGDADLPDIMADPTRTAEALINLGSNAIKYNRPGGYVEFSAERVAGGFLRIKVSDNGLGIAEQHQAGLFQEFNRLGAERTNIEGTGIGLALTKRLVEMMHGTIGFSSAPGEGSTFWIDLPVARGLPAPH